MSANRPRNGTPLDADALLREARAHHAAGRLDAAVTCCTTVLAASPDHAEALHLLGMLRVTGGDPEAGIRLLRHAAEVAPTYGANWDNLGIALRGQQHADEAMECFRRVLACETRDAARLDRIGMLFGDAGRLDDAVDCFRRAVAADPNFAAAHGNLGIALDRLGRLAEAAESFRRALASRPDDATLFRLGVVLAAVAPVRRGDRLLSRGRDGAASRRRPRAFQPWQRARRAEPAQGGAGELHARDRAAAGVRRGALERGPGTAAGRRF